MNETTRVVCGILLFLVLALFAAGRKGKNRWEAYYRGGKDLLDDFDEERNDIDNLTR